MGFANIEPTQRCGVDQQNIVILKVSLTKQIEGLNPLNQSKTGVSTAKVVL
jgi:hypothetical protein